MISKGDELKAFLSSFSEFSNVRGRGLMIAFEVELLAKEFRKKLLFEHKIFTGSATGANTIRLLPPLSIGASELNNFKQGINSILKSNEAISIS